MSHTNYNGISTKNTADEKVVNNPNEIEDVTKLNANAAETEPETNTDETNEPEYILGTVAGCAKLNVRKQPSTNAEVLFVIGKDSDVLVDLDESTDDWYKVYINEQEGFCMKKFIKLAQ